jgi:hypothetical protein
MLLPLVQLLGLQLVLQSCVADLVIAYAEPLQNARIYGFDDFSEFQVFVPIPIPIIPILVLNNTSTKKYWY